jgi:hypothetical protein
VHCLQHHPPMAGAPAAASNAVLAPANGRGLPFALLLCGLLCVCACILTGV